MRNKVHTNDRHPYDDPSRNPTGDATDTLKLSGDTSASMDTNRVITGDMFDAVADLPANSVHAVVTDPPYGLAFMGRDWDDFDPREYQDFSERWASAVRRVLVPGGHLLAFSGNRTHHRAFVGIEDAGFEIRDTLTWHYGGGFPKGTSLDKRIDKRLGVDRYREVVGRRSDGAQNTANSGWVQEVDSGIYDGDSAEYDVTEPASDEAAEWQGWSTQLKPATEFVSLARAPIADTVVDNVLEWATGALNIDACRIPTTDEWDGHDGVSADTTNAWGNERLNAQSSGSHPGGRYPANVTFDDRAARLLDTQSGILQSGDLLPEHSATKDSRTWRTDGEHRDLDRSYGGDSGGASRFFYTPKASKSERTHDGAIDNDHPTVKPVDLCAWLVRLVTRPEQTVLDPFCGSGSVLLACKSTNRRFIGIEKNERYADIARERVGIGARDKDRVVDRPDDATMLGDFA